MQPDFPPSILPPHRHPSPSRYENDDPLQGSACPVTPTQRAAGSDRHPSPWSIIAGRHHAAHRNQWSDRDPRGWQLAGSPFYRRGRATPASRHRPAGQIAATGPQTRFGAGAGRGDDCLRGRGRRTGWPNRGRSDAAIPHARAIRRAGGHVGDEITRVDGRAKDGRAGAGHQRAGVAQSPRRPEPVLAQSASARQPQLRGRSSRPAATGHGRAAGMPCLVPGRAGVWVCQGGG